MITEDYVSFEIAKLLKEKGFPQEYDMYHSMVYNEEDYEDEYEIQRMVLETRFVKAGTLSSYPVGVPGPKCYCSTLQTAMKWLREKHRIFLNVSYIPEHFAFTYRVISPSGETKFVTYVDTYEKACEAAIKYCLENLI